ncbi:hypothetical protein [Marivirga sp.]|uniref:hypothetical protein n=1 Tax=Marivirga sp. TaxID=2018662 RepID=UPI0025EEA167|nr:hypothetical protein [Marivirga sp.]
MPKGNCKLCDNYSELLESHVIPKSIYKWLKKTSGTGILRGGQNMNIPIQDGFKYYWLCRNCEQKFGQSEKYFIENIFKPVNHNLNESEFRYDNRLRYFLCSIWWRIIQHSLTEQEVLQCKFIDQIRAYGLKLAEFLNSKPQANLNPDYLLLLDEIKDAPPAYKDLNFIFLRTVDPLLMFDQNSCFLSLRIPKFYFFHDVTGLNHQMMKPFELNLTERHFKAIQTPLQEPHVCRLISQRIAAFQDMKKQVSDNQSNKTHARHVKNQKKWFESNSFRAWIMDRRREE